LGHAFELIENFKIILNAEHRKFSTSLAPMRGVTTRHFFDIIDDYGRPDEYIFEFLRVHETAAIPDSLVDAIESRKIDTAASVQLLGREPKHFVKIAKLFQKYKIKAINLNFGCPMPKINKKGVGGALLKELEIIDEIISRLCESVDLPISVKTRTGYEHSSELDRILDVLSRHRISALYLHGRTVRGLYSEPVNFECITTAKRVLRCPVIANGDIRSASEATWIIESTGADGVMIGRMAVANPWIFRQINELYEQKRIFAPSGVDYMNYVERLKSFNSSYSESHSVSAMKKYVVPLADFVDASGDFSSKIRRVTTLTCFGDTCEKFFANL
jgi:nifR3 family TIM-barrel protein